MADRQRGKPAAKSKEELRREKLREQERQKKRRNAVLLVALVLVIIAVAAVLSVTVFFRVSAVEVDASKTQYSLEQVRDASGVSEGDALLLLNREKVKTRISEQLPYTGEITVKRSLPSKVKITVEDSSIAAAVRYNDQFILLNEDNKVLAKVSSITKLNALVESQEKKAAAQKSTKKSSTKTTSAEDDATATTTTTTTTTAAETELPEEEEPVTENLKEIQGGEDLANATDSVCIIQGVNVQEAKVGHILKASNKDIFNTYTNVMKAMRDHNVTGITSIDLTKVSDIRLVYQKRITILLGSATGLDHKAALCEKVLQEQNKVSTEQKGQIDLSIEGKAYFSEGGATTRTTTTLPTEPVTDVNSTVPVSESAEGQVTAVPGTDGATAVTDPGATVTSTTENDLVNTGG